MGETILWEKQKIFNYIKYREKILKEFIKGNIILITVLIGLGLLMYFY